MTKFSLDAKIGSYGPRRQNGPVEEPEIRRAIAAEALKQSNERFSPSDWPSVLKSENGIAILGKFKSTFMATKQTRPARANSAGKDDVTFPVISARYTRVREFAQFCNVSETLARRWIYSGAIPAVKIQGLVMIDALRAEQVMATRHAFKPVKTSPQKKGG